MAVPHISTSIERTTSFTLQQPIKARVRSRSSATRQYSCSTITLDPRVHCTAGKELPRPVACAGINPKQTLSAGSTLFTKRTNYRAPVSLWTTCSSTLAPAPRSVAAVCSRGL